MRNIKVLKGYEYVILDGTIICFVDYSQEYLEIVQFSRLATIRHFMNSDCFLCHYNLLLQSF